VADYHLVHLGARALGGAAMVMAEMTCTSADARITPGCPGLWTDAQMHDWARIVAWFLKPGGKLVLAEGHPAALVFDDAASTERPHVYFLEVLL
jgi:anthraniloyl-CoA monooxygenase